MSEIIQPTPEDVDKIRGYKISKWKHHDNYECLYCQYSTLWIEKMVKHQALGEHPWAFPGQSDPNALSQDDNTDDLSY